MVSVTFIEHSGTSHHVEGYEGGSLMEAAIAGGVPGILADCGGALSCATCHVHVRPAWMEAIGTPSETEAIMLEMAVEPSANSRLSCQIRLTAALSGLEVEVPASQF